MKVVYTAPNRAHHFFYAKVLHEAGILKAFVSGFSRLSPRSKLPEIGKALHQVDFLQTVFVITIKLRLPEKITNWFAYYAKVEQDKACKKYVKDADIFLFYNGSGLSTCLYAKHKKIITVVEVVNTHVDYQERILAEEHKRLNLPFTPFHKKEKERRIQEYNAADYIMYPSEFVKRSFLEYGFPENKMVKVTYGYDTLEQPDTIVSNTDNFTVLYVGSVSVRKGLRYLVQAFNKLDRIGKRLIIVGSSAELTGLEDIDLPPNIELTGALKGNHLSMMYQQADVFCLPSIEDGFGLVIGEALSYGIPVIATVNTGAFEIINEGKNGFIVPIRSADAIYEKLKLLADNNELLKKMREEAVITAKKLKGWDVCKEQLIAALYHCEKR